MADRHEFRTFVGNDNSQIVAGPVPQRAHDSLMADDTPRFFFDAGFA
jgi:hypothetical protein